MRRNKLFILVVLITLLSVGWSIFWFVRGNITESIVQSYIDSEYEGWDFDYSDISIRGFPNRTDLRIHDLRITNTFNEIDFTLGDLNIFSLVYNWKDYIVAFAPVQSAVVKGVKYIVDSDYPRLSFSLNNQAGIPLTSLIAEINKTTITASDETSLKLDSGLFAIKPDETNSNNFLVHLNLGNIALSNASTKLALEPFDFIGGGELLLSGSDPSQCISIEEADFSSKFVFEEFDLQLEGEIKNDFGLPNGSLSINLVGEKEKFFAMLKANRLISSLQLLFARNFLKEIQDIKITNGNIKLLNFIDFKIFDSFPEFC